jgi:hypothetical protein
MGEFIEDLKNEGLMENTIIFYRRPPVLKISSNGGATHTHTRASTCKVRPAPARSGDVRRLHGAVGRACLGIWLPRVRLRPLCSLPRTCRDLSDLLLRTFRRLRTGSLIIGERGVDIVAQSVRYVSGHAARAKPALSVLPRRGRVVERVQLPRWN